MVLSVDSNCSATSFDVELCAEKLKSLGVQVSSSCVISLGDPVGVDESWIDIICICTHIVALLFIYLYIFLEWLQFPMVSKSTVMILA